MSTKLLGIHINHSLNYETHINKLCKQLSSRISLFYRLRKYLSKKVLNFLYKSIIRPKLEYGCVLWGYTYNTHLDKLFKIQKRFARLITNSDHLSHSLPLFERLDWMRLKNAIKYESLIYIFKSINGFGSNFSENIFELNANRTSRRHTGRDRLYINVPTAHKNFMQNTVFVAGAKLWNQLPLDMRSEATVKSFKTRLKTFNFNNLV